jgi:hypothetical protein
MTTPQQIAKDWLERLETDSDDYNGDTSYYFEEADFYAMIDKVIEAAKEERVYTHGSDAFGNGYDAHGNRT